MFVSRLGGSAVTRFAVPVLALVLLCARVDAQPASFSIIEVKVVKDKIEWPVTQAVPVSKGGGRS